MCFTTFEELPREILEHIAFYVAQETPGPPAALLRLLVLSRKIFAVLDPARSENQALYAWIFRAKFDHESVERRWRQLGQIEGRREKLQLLKSAQTQVHPDLPFDATRLPLLAKPPAGDDAPWAPLTSRDYAAELRRRFEIMHQMRAAVRHNAAYDRTSRPSSPRAYAHTPHAVDLASGIPATDDVTQILWTCYLMLIENDGKNLALLLAYGRLQEYMRLFYEKSLLREALSPGWPRQTVGRALGLWIGWLGGDDPARESSAEAEQRFFVLKPYVFAAHRFDGFYAPWSIKKLPVALADYPIRPPPDDALHADLRPRLHAQVITHMGRTLTMTSPVLSHAAILSFFQRKTADTASDDGEGDDEPTAALPSTTYDLDFLRLALCVNPYASRGLPALAARGSLAGAWEGHFSFFDFDSFKDMLGGHMRALYDGPFGDQPNVWKIEETIVRRRRGEPAGGRGPVTNAGFTSDDMAIPSMGKHGTKRARLEELDDDTCSDSDDYEILLSGSGHSAWGKFVLRGRVRLYDGMFTLVKQYTPDSRGRWLYRGYCTGGYLVGRWRDTWSPVGQNAYEGTFLMSRRIS